MVEATALRTGNFEWNIQNPFLPWRSHEAKFCHGSPNSKLWKVVLESMHRRVNYREFLVTLEYLEWFEPRYEIVADSVKVSVSLKGQTIKIEERRMYPFCVANRFKYYMDLTAEMSPQPTDKEPLKMKPHDLVIRIEISLPGTDAENLPSTDASLRILSRDLELLLRNPKYPDMTLWSADRRQNFPVHSCIVDARWDNFSKKHRIFGDDWHNVETKISCSLLYDILTYVYSGTIRTSSPDWKTAAYATELFQVMEWYGMNHFYKAFVKDDLQQVRVTGSPVVIGSLLFPLGIFEGRPANSASYSWNVDSEPGHEIVFRIRVGNEAGNWLSYSVLSKSPSRVHAEVNFRLERVVEGEKLRTLPFHEQEFTVIPKRSVAPRSALFLGCLETFGDFVSPPADGKEAKYFVHCFLNFTYETTVEQMTSVGGDALHLASEMLAVLSDDMRQVQKRKLRADMQILSLPEFLAGTVLSERVHRAIIAARLPEWWEAFENAQPESDIPELARSTLSFETLPPVLEYIYTGNPNIASKISFPHVQEVERFSQQTLFSALHGIVVRIPSREFYIDPTEEPLQLDSGGKESKTPDQKTFPKLPRLL